MINSKQLLEVISEAKKGKRQAQNILMDLFWGNVYHYVLIRVQNENDAEDIAIETFTKVFSKLKLYNSDFDFKTWVISVAHNTMIDYFRKKNNRIVYFEDELTYYEIDSEEPSPEDDLIQRQSQEDFIKKIQKLKPKYREIIELRYLEDKTYKEISEELGLSMANVKVCLLRAKQLLSEII